MHARTADPMEILFTIACFGVGGSVLALAGIWLEMRRGPRASRTFSGVLCLFILALAAILWETDEPAGVVGQLLALGLACLAACALHVARVRRWANRILEPGAIWALLLVVSPTFAVVYAHRLNKPEDLPAFLAELGSGLGKEVVGPRAVTSSQSPW